MQAWGLRKSRRYVPLVPRHRPPGATLTTKMGCIASGLLVGGAARPSWRGSFSAIVNLLGALPVCLPGDAACPGTSRAPCPCACRAMRPLMGRGREPPKPEPPAVFPRTPLIFSWAISPLCRPLHAPRRRYGCPRPLGGRWHGAVGTGGCRRLLLNSKRPCK